MSKIVPVSHRMPIDLKERLEQAAASNNRSANAELVYRLEKSLSDDDNTHDKLDEIIVRLKALNVK
ncbi:Arc family DNA-binding protein [Psychrobacter glacincola]|uniref:Arc family DNA-binding protein n=1 Tax=Psychrobacter glacincola TaxID=56810 RepID=UPI0039B0F382